MNRVKESLTELRNNISTKKDDLARRKSVSVDEGGTEEEVTKKIQHEEGFSDSSSDDEDDDKITGKSLDDFLDRSDPPEIQRRYGKLPLAQSQGEEDEFEQWTSLARISEKAIEEKIAFRGRVHIVRRMSPALVFIVFREQITTIQGVLLCRDGEVSESMVRWAEHLRPGNIVVVRGKLQPAEQRVKTATYHKVEVLIDELHVVVERKHQIPFSVYEAEAATDGHAIADRVRLSNRILDLRTPTSQSVFRIQSAVCSLFRSYLDSQGFLEIHTPKLQGGATEGGADVFKLDYFGRPAFLAQSPQLAKQMCISADMRRVYEIGPVFRAENSNTPRHMTEYTGLDLETEIDHHYHEAMWLIDATLKHIFEGLYKGYRNEIETLKHHFPHHDLVWLEKTPVIPFAEGAKILNDSGWRNDDGSTQSEDDDLPTKGERRLGELVKEKYNTDYYILDKFPVSARPFYTMPDPTNSKITNSFDFMVRGQEILSGGQRIHDVELLLGNLNETGIDPTSIQEYVEAFEWVAPPHAGAGIGMERLVSLILDLGNIRYATLFPRDPRSFPADSQLSNQLRHPEQNTIHRRKGHLQPLGSLIANYGDSTNTSWFDNRYQIWRDSITGAAVAYVPVHSRAILPGNPLCETSQLEEVIGRFLQWLKNEKRLRPIFLLVDKPVETVVGEKFGWKSFSSVAEQRVNLANSEHLDVDADFSRKIRHAQKEGVKVSNYGHDVPSDVRSRCDEAIKRWQGSRQGEQVHLSDVTPWIDPEHRTYFVAEDEDQKPHALVVVAQLAPRYGAQIKWAIDFPDAANGVIEYTVQTALKHVATSEKTCTFGSGATSDLASGHNVGTAKATSLNSIYQAYAARFHVDRKTGFRAKFNASEDPVYFCYPRGAMGQKGIRAIVDFFKE